MYLSKAMTVIYHHLSVITIMNSRSYCTYYRFYGESFMVLKCVTCKLEIQEKLNIYMLLLL